MTRDDLRVLCTALGFLAVVLKEEPLDHQATRASSVARLIESFCLVTVPDELGVKPTTIAGVAGYDHLDRAIDRYKAALVEKGEAYLPEERDSLLQFYDRLLTRKTRREQRAFYASGSDDMIANRILQLVTEEIEQDEHNAGGNA